MPRTPRRTAWWLTAAAGASAGGYAVYAAYAWRQYGRPAAPAPEERDERLDRFMPVYEVVDRHRIAVAAPAHVTLDVACSLQLSSIPAVRAIFKGRELILGSRPDTRDRPRELVPEMLSIGWGVLDEVPGHEMIFGAVTKPWEPNVTFRALTPGTFASFSQPGYVKIAWTLRADPTGGGRSVFVTETRAVATDDQARARFRWYWAWLSPGIRMIRRMTLGPVRREAERRARSRMRAAPPTPTPPLEG